MTYSIVARDAHTGDIGVAVQSHWFSVGSVVTWAESGVGAVATQSFAEPAYGPRGLALLRLGVDPVTALAALTSADPEQSRRQVAFVDAAGRVAVHTGAQCIEAAGHVTAEGVSCQANMMRGPEVWPAMLQAYRRRMAILPIDLMAALDAAEAAGGDIRGRQSASMLIVKATGSDQPWQDRVVDLRVDDRRIRSASCAASSRCIALPAHGDRRAATRSPETWWAVSRRTSRRARSLQATTRRPSGRPILMADAGRVEEGRALLADIAPASPAGVSCSGACPRPGCSPTVRRRRPAALIVRAVQAGR